LTVAGLILGFCALGPAGTAAAAAPAWWNYNRPAEYATVRTSVYVPVSDGTLIYCSLARPAKNGQPVPGRFPALIEEYLPYGAEQLTDDIPGDDFWADHGYVALNCDIRGTGLSGGVWAGILSSRENEDDYDLLEWMREQPWSNGRVGQTGASYGGMTTLRVASLNPPGLMAILPISGEYDIYDQSTYPGGIMANPATLDDWPFADVALSGGRELAAETYAQYVQHPLWDSFWQQIAVSPKWKQIKIPVLDIGGWQDDIMIGGAPTNWMGLRAAGDPQDYAILGPWYHATTGPPYNLPMGAQLAWFDHWVMRLKSAPLPTSPVTTFQEPTGVIPEGESTFMNPTELPAGENSGAGWQSYSSWPPPGTHNVSYALTGGNTLAVAPGPATKESYTTSPTDAGSTSDIPGQIGPTAQTLVFSTLRLSQALTVAGNIQVNLRASLSYTNGNFKALVYDVAPNGSTTYVQDGYLKASSRVSLSEDAPVVPGKLTDFSIRFYPMDWRFGVGNELRFVIYGGESTELVPEPVPVTTTVSLGAGGSTLSLPVLGVPAGCPSATGRVDGTRLGLARLGMTRAQARRAFVQSSDRGKHYEDFFCLTPIGVRVGYASPELMKTLPRHERRKYAGRVVWISTSNPYYALHKVRAGDTLAAARKHLKLPSGFHIGLNYWYLAPNGPSTAILKVRHGIVEEIGIGDKSLTETRKGRLAFLTSFY
jgi:hypothetical protein